MNDSGIVVGPEFTLDTRDPELPPIDDGGPEDLNESGIGVGPEFTLDTRDPELPVITPFDFNATALRISEDALVNSYVGKFFRISGDENKSVNFSFEYDGPVSSTPFVIESDGALILSGTLDYEQKNSFQRA